MDEFDVTELVKFRREAKELAEGEGIKLTYMPFIIKAAALALRSTPSLMPLLPQIRMKLC